MASASRNTYRIFVSNLPWTVNPQKLKAHFSKFGDLGVSTVTFDKNTGFSRNFGFIKFADESGYKSALNAKRHILDGFLIRVSPAKN
ncbi:unnamed protein product [Nesidiocoris tenuis]|uniref:RRM domain-containing protein n=1 Tax=Nesidiocoris tenuis TaxID=355587 RepID=A0A6H5GI57_9HEMI|nr:unnamed protein product [Nesidiocoris tenuis]